MNEIKLSDHFTYSRLMRFTLPSIAGMLFTSIYGVVDGLFVSNYAGKDAFASINLIMPFWMVIGAIGFMIGTGGTALVARTLGEGDTPRANRYFSMLTAVTILSGLLTSAVGLLFLRPICTFLGATDAMMADCLSYGRIVFAFNAIFLLQNLFQSFFITAEKPKLGFYFTVSAGIANMILDALFVAVFRWGIVGAALATGLSQCIGGIIPLVYFAKPNQSLLQLGRPCFELKPLIRACTNGVSEMMSSVSGSIVGMAYNFQLMHYAGSDGVAAYGVLMYVNFIFVAICIGYTVGAAPIVSFHFGANNRTELKNVLRKSLVMMAIAGFALTLLAEGCAPLMAGFFVGYDAGLYAMTRRAFTIASIGFLMAGINIYTSSFFTALNNGLVSAILAFMRSFLLQMGAILILPRLFGLDGIWAAGVVCDTLGLILSAVFLLVNRKRYGY